MLGRGREGRWEKCEGYEWEGVGRKKEERDAGEGKGREMGEKGGI